jgi:predicted O-methyltransferase YrrM
LSAGLNEEIPPKWDDLVRLYKLIRDRKPFQILEFGSGFSTVVMAHALKQNWNDYRALRSINAGGR